MDSNSSNGKNLSLCVNEAFAENQPTSALTKFAENDVLGARGGLGCKIDCSTEKAMQDKQAGCLLDDVPTPDLTEPASGLALGNLGETRQPSL